MLRQEELEFIKAMSNIKLSPIFLRKLAKAVAVGMKKAIVVSKANATTESALERQSRVGSEDLTFRDSSKLPVSIKKAEELLAQTGCLSSPATGLRQCISSVTAPGRRAPRANLLPRAVGRGEAFACPTKRRWFQSHNQRTAIP